MFRFAMLALVAAGLALSAGNAQQFNKVLKVGDAAPTFANLTGVDDKTLSLNDLKSKDVVVIAITCNHCPVAVAYEDRLIEFAKKYTSSADSKVALVAINVNNGEQDKLPAMKVRAKEKGFNFPYVYDPSQKVGKDYGASVTPEFYVLGKDRKIVYMGALDDANDATKAKVNYVEAAVKAALEGKAPETKETRARGCGVQYDK
jgi:peroxiredoxin